MFFFSIESFIYRTMKISFFFYFILCLSMRNKDALIIKSFIINSFLKKKYYP